MCKNLRPVFIMPGTPGIGLPDMEAQESIITIDHVPLAKASGRYSATGEMVPRQKPFRVSIRGVEYWFKTLAEAKAWAKNFGELD